MSKPAAPCLGCQERTQDCHFEGKCDRWTAYREAMDQYHKKKDEIHQSENDFESVRVKRHLETRKRRNLR